MDSYSACKPGHLAWALLIGCLLALGSLAGTAWAAPDQQPLRQSVPTSPYTPTPTPKPKQETRPTATPEPAAATTPTPQVPLMPETGTDVQTGQSPNLVTLTLLCGGMALSIVGLSLRRRKRGAR